MILHNDYQIHSLVMMQHIACIKGVDPFSCAITYCSLSSVSNWLHFTVRSWLGITNEQRDSDALTCTHTACLTEWIKCWKLANRQCIKLFYLNKTKIRSWKKKHDIRQELH